MRLQKGFFLIVGIWPVRLWRPVTWLLTVDANTLKIKDSYLLFTFQISKMVFHTIFPLICVALILHSCEALFLSTPNSTCSSNLDCHYQKCIQHSDYALCNLGSKYEIIYRKVASSRPSTIQFLTILGVLLTEMCY